MRCRGVPVQVSDRSISLWLQAGLLCLDLILGSLGIVALMHAAHELS